ncbi:FAD:protein FMN transferase [Acinetobacter sp. EC24]|nr:FAD:protein FMN transferase [Acinetobacter rathckeae]MBF7694968.1 FAD:protein FMN transferase [Acinetobacter rathckeae]
MPNKSQLMVDRVHVAISQAYQVIESVQSLMSFHDKNSALNQLNATAHTTVVQTHPWIYAVLQRAQKIHHYSDGLFDCSIAPILVDYGFLPTHQSHNNTNNQWATQKDVILLSQNRVQFKSPLSLDLGGIAKGFAVDLALHCLRQHHIKHVVINAGGDLRVMGDFEEAIYIRNPVQPSQVKYLGSLSNGAIATSGSYFATKMYHQQQVSHLIDPLTQQSVVTDQSFTVLAPQAWLADALTKVLVLSENTEHTCFKHFGAKALIIEKFESEW